MIDDLDLVDQMDWEDSEKVEFISLETAGLENADCDTIGRISMDNYFGEEM